MLRNVQIRAQALAAAWAELFPHVRLVDAEHEFIRFAARPTLNSDGSEKIALDDRWDVHMDAKGVPRLANLAGELGAELEDRIAVNDLQVELLRELGRVMMPHSDLDRSFAALMRRLQRYTAGAVVAIPLGGLFSSAEAPIELGLHACVGHVSRETEVVIGDLARRHALDGFRFTSEAWWTEEFLAAEEDSGFAAELEEKELLEGTWQPLVLAVAIHQVGVLASFTGLELAQSFLGALLLLASEREDLRYSAAPWILGDVGLNEDARLPQFGEDGGLAVAPLQVDSLPGRSYAAISELDYRHFTDVDVAELVADSASRSIVAGAVTRAEVAATGADVLQDAMRLVFAARFCPPDVAIGLLQRAALSLGTDRQDELLRQPGRDSPRSDYDGVMALLRRQAVTWASR
jgi:hypothetical protein